MKKKITACQLFEVSDEKINKLANMLKRKTSLEEIKKDREHYEKYKETNGYTLMIEGIRDRCTIGNLIEVLCDTNFCFPNIGLTESRKRSECIVVGVTSLGGSKEFKGKTFEADELCDALWEAVKVAI